MRKNEEMIAIYSRKSKFTGKGESIGNQVELCKEYIRVHYGDAAVDKVIVYEDEGFSGGNLNRPDFKKMMDAAKKRKFKAIIVYRLDRISRNISDFSTLIEELARLDISFVSIKEQFDTSTPMGRAMMYIASVFSQLERETIAERIRDNMHELAKTGRWLGGTTPTGYASEAVKSVTIDGKSKKACKLKLIPEEADIVRMIYDLYIETDSLTLTEAALIKQGIKTKNNNYFTRFSIKAILQNPVYMIADEDAYNFFIQHDTDLFSEKDAFDNKHGIMAYNRTDQEKGRATKYLPASEWIVSVGKHPGLIPGKVWVQIQESLERNKSKSFRKPRSNEALLTGLLFCSCGERMYPKLSKRKTADGKVIYTYVCKMKERSQRSVCNSKNANGNTLDMAVVEQIKMLAEDKDTFIAQLEQSRRFYTGNRMDYEQRLDDMRKEKAETEKKINSLVDSLVDMGDSPAKAHVTKRIEQLNGEYQSLEQRIQELEGLTSQHALSDIEFDLLRQLLTIFKDGIDEMTVEQKRAAIRTIVRKVVWDGVNAHVILFGVKDDEIEYPEIAAVASGNTEEEDETEELVDFSDIDYDDDDMEDERLGKTNPLSASKTHWGEDSKRDFNVPAQKLEPAAGRQHRRAAEHRHRRKRAAADGRADERRPAGRRGTGAQRRARRPARCGGAAVAPGAPHHGAALRPQPRDGAHPEGGRRHAGHLPKLYFPARKAHHPPSAPGAGGSGIKNLRPCRGLACPAPTGQCLLHHRLRPGIRHKLHRQPGDHVHLGLQRVQQVLVPLPRPRYTGDAPGVLALGHGDTVNVVLLYILKCQVKKAGGVKHLPGPGRAQAHAAARHNVVVDLRDLPLNEPVAVGNDGFIAGRGRDAEPAGLPIVGLQILGAGRASAVRLLPPQDQHKHQRHRHHGQQHQRKDKPQGIYHKNPSFSVCYAAAVRRVQNLPVCRRAYPPILPVNKNWGSAGCMQEK